MGTGRYCSKIFLLSAGSLSLAWVSASEEPRKGPGLERLEVFEYKFLDVNQINCTIASDGPYADSRRTSAAGLEWPRGSGRTAVFTAGIWIVGKHRPTDSLRTANMDYSTEYQPGPLLEIFNTTTNDDTGPVLRAGSPLYRLYKISRGDTLSRDYREWPGHLGAPYEDLNGNGVWDTGIDIPRFFGDQQIWCLINDVNLERHRALGATAPMGVEVRILYYAFDRPGVLGNAMFMRWEIINKSDAAYDSVYFSMWSDPDLGDANDDLPGCDTTLNMGYVYNGDNDDGTRGGYGATPPALGFVYLGGPELEGTSGDSGRSMTSFVAYDGGMFAQLVDPPDASPNYARIAYAYLKGMMGTAGTYLMRPDSSIITYFFSGDPVTGTGDLPSNFPLREHPPCDIRIVVNSGPFTLAEGDTQVVVGALLLSQGVERLHSIATLRQDVRFIQAFYASSMDTLQGRAIAVSPGSLVFDRTHVGTGGEVLEVALMNFGSEAVQIIRIDYPSLPEFAPVNPPSLPLALQPYERADVAIRFSPSLPGVFTDTLVIQTDDSLLGRISIPVTGTAYEMIQARPDLIYANSQYYLYTIDPGTGTVSRVGPVSVQGVASLALHPDTHLLHGFCDGADASSTLYQICAENPDVSPIGGSETRVRGFGFTSGDTIYAAAEDGSIHRLSYPDLGDVSLKTASGISYTALAVHPATGELWAAARGVGVETRSDIVYRVDKSTGIGTFVGYTGGRTITSSLAFDADGILWGLKRAEGQDYLVRIDTLTGAGTTVLELGEHGLIAMAMRSDTMRVLSVREGGVTLPEEYALHQNYPNPFNPVTTIEFAIPAASYVSLKVYSVLGQVVATLVEEGMDPGIHRAIWDASDVSSGAYFYCLRVGTHAFSRKLIVVR